VCVLMDDEPASKETSKPVGQGWATSQDTQDTPQAASGSETAFIPKHTAIGALSQPVIHLQSPTIRTTYIHAAPLGLTLPWLGLQFRRLGTRECALEVGVVDAHGNAGRIRCSSFQVRSRLLSALYLEGNANDRPCIDNPDGPVLRHGHAGATPPPQIPDGSAADAMARTTTRHPRPHPALPRAGPLHRTNNPPPAADIRIDDVRPYLRELPCQADLDERARGRGPAGWGGGHG
jgi:hypothetical protein